MKETRLIWNSLKKSGIPLGHHRRIWLWLQGARWHRPHALRRSLWCCHSDRAGVPPWLALDRTHSATKMTFRVSDKDAQDSYSDWLTMGCWYTPLKAITRAEEYHTFNLFITKWLFSGPVPFHFKWNEGISLKKKGIRSKSQYNLKTCLALEISKLVRIMIDAFQECCWIEWSTCYMSQVSWTEVSVRQKFLLFGVWEWYLDRIPLKLIRNQSFSGGSGLWG